ncbi:MAG: class II aldolase/adducin family protein [Betaproteobacteria bacterium]|nr:class II aldolase/adducin family protein [Betaproteobacteria bacterium]MBI2959670.1 class II aldolase/adducin family protein [Betaproteobacteria bacterium]
MNANVKKGAAASGGPVDPALIDDLVAASRILAIQGVLDAYGHVSMRHPANPGRYLMSRSLAPELVTASDILEYDLDSNPVDPHAPLAFLERFIHGEIYKARPEVNAVVHSHSPSVVPFGVSSVPLRPIYHMSSFLHPGVPVFEIREAAGMTDLLVRNPELGAALARSLGERPVALMRGHGNVVVAKSVPLAVFRAIYTEVNARLQTQAIGLGGSVTYLAPEEGRKSEATNAGTIARPWELWKRRALGT